MKADLIVLPPTGITTRYNNEIPQGTMTPDTVETHIGKLSFQNGFPSEETTRELFKPLGIKKGKEFKPDPPQRKILEEAAQMGDAMARLFDGTWKLPDVELIK
jgi:hypothetical protein